MEENKLNKFKELYKNNLILLSFFFTFSFLLLCLYILFLSNFLKTKHNLRLCLVPGKCEGKCKGKKMEMKSQKKEKMKK